MADGIKISQFPPIQELAEGCCIPTVSNGENRKITYGALKNQIANELQSQLATTTDITDAVNWVTSGSWSGGNYTASNGSLLAIKDTAHNIVTLWLSVNVTLTGYETSGAKVKILSNLPASFRPSTNKVLSDATVNNDGSILLTCSSSKTNYSVGIAYKTN